MCHAPGRLRLAVVGSEPLLVGISSASLEPPLRLATAASNGEVVDVLGAAPLPTSAGLVDVVVVDVDDPSWDPPVKRLASIWPTSPRSVPDDPVLPLGDVARQPPVPDVPVPGELPDAVDPWGVRRRSSAGSHARHDVVDLPGKRRVGDVDSCELARSPGLEHVHSGWVLEVGDVLG